MSSKFNISSLEQLGAFAAQVLKRFPAGAVVGLLGDLGAGKTTFVRCLIEALASTNQEQIPRVTSPSFVIHQNYKVAGKSIEHFDLYRLENLSVDQLTELGYFEAIARARRSSGFVFVEWPEKCTDRGDLQLDASFQFSLSEGERSVLAL